MQTLDRPQPHPLTHALRAALADREPTVQAVDGASLAGVLVPLRYHGGQWHVVLNVRSRFIGRHPGEIAFPGGRLEPTDPDMRACALRETWEEMGIRPQDVEVLGPLDAVLTRTNFLVWPWVGVVPHPYTFNIDEREVEAVVEIPLKDLLDDGRLRHEARLQPDGSLLCRPSYAYGEHLIFGATAWILEQLLSLVRQITGPGGANSLGEAVS